MLTITIHEDGRIVVCDEKNQPIGFIQTLVVSGSPKQLAFMPTKERVQKMDEEYGSDGLSSFFHTMDTLSRHGFLVFCTDDGFTMDVRVSGNGIDFDDAENRWREVPDDDRRTD